MLTVATYNLFEFGNRTPTGDRRRGDVVEVIRSLDVDVLAVQEIGGDPDAKAAILDQLAADTGMCCRLGGTPALASSAYRYATAVLWHPRVQPVDLLWPGAGGFQRRIASVVLDVAGRRVAVGSYHADPARSYQRIDDAASLARCMTRGRFADAVVCGDFNDTSAAKTPDGRYLDPDWTQINTWNTNFIYETEWAYRDGQLHTCPDRRAAEILELGGLADVAGLLRTPPQPTAGHWPGDWSRDRRKDRFYVTANLKAALRGIAVARNEVALRASDHLPAVLTLDVTALIVESPAVER